MKRFNWLLIGMVIVCLAIVPLLVGCVSKSEYEALQADYNDLKANYKTVEAELAQIKEVYPLKNFPSAAELRDWASAHTVSHGYYALSTYRAAVEVQEKAMLDGYLVSAVVAVMEETLEAASAYCLALANGDLYWWDPADAEVHLFFTKYELEY